MGLRLMPKVINHRWDLLFCSMKFASSFFHLLHDIRYLNIVVQLVLVSANELSCPYASSKTPLAWCVRVAPKDNMKSNCDLIH